jgi:hypothetical protein
VVFVGFLRQSCCFILIYALFYTKYRFLLSLISSVFHFLYWLCSLLVFNLKIRSWFSFFLRVCLGFEKNSIFVFFLWDSVCAWVLSVSFLFSMLCFSFFHFQLRFKDSFSSIFFLTMWSFLLPSSSCFFIVVLCESVICINFYVFEEIDTVRVRFKCFLSSVLALFLSFLQFFVWVSFTVLRLCWWVLFLFIRYYLFGFWEIHEKQMNESRRMGRNHINWNTCDSVTR